MGDDLAVADFETGQVDVLLKPVARGFAPPVAYRVGQNPVALVTGDFNGDGRTDLAVANASSGDVSVLLGRGDGTFQGAVVSQTGDNPQALAACNFNGDAREDLAIAIPVISGGDGPEGPGVDVLLGNGDGMFQTRASNPVGEGPDASVSGVFTRSGNLDLVTANQGSNDVSVLLGNGDGTFQPAQSFPAGVVPIAVVAGDFNTDFARTWPSPTRAPTIRMWARPSARA